MGRFLIRFTSKNQFLFHESKLFYRGIQYPQKPLHPHWEVHQIVKIGPFSVKPLITLTNKFYFGVLIRAASETGCESLIDQ